MFRLLALTFAGAVVILLLVICIQLILKAMPSIGAFGWSFITSKEWDPVAENFGALPYVFCTVVSSVLALALALPVSLGVAIFLVELAPDWLRNPLSMTVELPMG